jgi:hypothetical protein
MFTRYADFPAQRFRHFAARVPNLPRKPGTDRKVIGGRQYRHTIRDMRVKGAPLSRPLRECR